MLTKHQRKKLQAITKSAIIDFLTSHTSATDDAILEYAISACSLTPQQLADKSPNGTLNVARSIAGLELSSLVAEGAVTEEYGEFLLVKEVPVVVQEEKCEKEMLSLLSKTSLGKSQLFEQLEKSLGTDKTLTRTDDSNLRSIAGTILKRLQERGVIACAGGKYFVSEQTATSFDFTPSGELALKKAFLKKLYSMGGAFFERYFMNLLDIYYRAQGKKIKTCKVLGGSSDGGIDGIIETEDSLGFREQIMVQTKCRNQTHATEKEVREFYGAVRAKKGSRGIFATTATFHYGAKEWISKLDDLIGVDGDKLFLLALSAKYGIKKTKNGYILDETAFF